MPSKKCLAAPSDTVYIYDGSFTGLLCCVYESVYTGELPMDIVPEVNAQPSLYTQKWVEADAQKAAKVEASIPLKISQQAYELVQRVFLSCLAQKELATLRFLLLGYQEGAVAMNMLGHDDVAPMMAAAQNLGGEVHLLTGFVRFSDHGGVLVSTITPKNFVLPLLAGHFITRFPCEDFLIYDKTHKAALIYQKGEKSIVPLEKIDFPEVGEDELHYRALWKRFYKTISIEARENPRCRMTHMPKRYWANMTEMQEFL